MQVNYLFWGRNYCKGVQLYGNNSRILLMVCEGIISSTFLSQAKGWSPIQI
jgi:hypothetical protein